MKFSCFTFFYLFIYFFVSIILIITQAIRMKKKRTVKKILCKLGAHHIQDSATTTRIEFAIGNLAVQLVVVG